MSLHNYTRVSVNLFAVSNTRNRTKITEITEIISKDTTGQVLVRSRSISEELLEFCFLH